MLTMEGKGKYAKGYLRTHSTDCLQGTISFFIAKVRDGLQECMILNCIQQIGCSKSHTQLPQILFADIHQLLRAGEGIPRTFDMGAEMLGQQLIHASYTLDIIVLAEQKTHQDLPWILVEDMQTLVGLYCTSEMRVEGGQVRLCPPVFPIHVKITAQRSILSKQWVKGVFGKTDQLPPRHCLIDSVLLRPGKRLS